MPTEALSLHSHGEAEENHLSKNSRGAGKDSERSTCPTQVRSTTASDLQKRGTNHKPICTACLVKESA